MIGRQLLIVIATFILGLIITLGMYMAISKKHIAVVSHSTSSHFSLKKAPSESLVGHIASMSGEVLWESRIATQSSPLSAPQAIQQGEEVDTGKDGLGSISFYNTLTFTLSNN